MELIERLSDVGASDGELNRLEATLGSTLPEDYRKFMSDLNGGAPSPSRFAFDTPSGKSDSSVRFFLTLDGREEEYTVGIYLQGYHSRIPPKTVPIASDSFGNLVLLDVGAKAAGSVYFWDHEEESEDEPTWDNVFLIAPTFTDFLNQLE